MTELCRYPITNTGLKNDLIIMVFYSNLTGVRKGRRTHEEIKISWNIGSSCYAYVYSSWEDVSFMLAKDNQIIYYFPECYENNSTENDSIGMFDSVEAVGFQDIDGDGAKDVIL